LDVVQGPGDLLAVAGDEGDRGSLVQQPGGGLDLGDADVQFLRDALDDRRHGDSGKKEARG